MDILDEQMVLADGSALGQGLIGLTDNTNSVFFLELSAEVSPDGGTQLTAVFKLRQLTKV